MNRSNCLLFPYCLAWLIIFLSCNKEELCINCGEIPAQENRGPIANAGEDQIITLPDSAFLDGSLSSDPDDNIVSYEWTKIAGPDLFSISNPRAAQTYISNLTGGIYQLQLKVTDAAGNYSTDTVRLMINPLPGEQSNVNVLFFFRDPTGGLDAENISVIESFDPRLVLVKVKIEGFPDAEIEGVWSMNYSPWCPISTIYVDATSYGTFNLPPGSYFWTAESVTTNFNSYPVPASFRKYWEAGSHTAQGTITVIQGDSCIIKEIVF